MRDLELALKAAADPTRTRILKLLEPGALCVCQLQAVLGLAPSTVSKHLSLLKLAGLVDDRRSGKWIAYELARSSPNPHAQAVLGLLRGVEHRAPLLAADRRRRREIVRIPMTKLCSLAPSRVPMPRTRPAGSPRRP